MVHLEDEVKNLEALAGAHADSRRNARSIVRQADKRIPELEVEREELAGPGEDTPDSDENQEAGR